MPQRCPAAIESVLFRLPFCFRRLFPVLCGLLRRSTLWTCCLCSRPLSFRLRVPMHPTMPIWFAGPCSMCVFAIGSRLILFLWKTFPIFFPLFRYRSQGFDVPTCYTALSPVAIGAFGLVAKAQVTSGAVRPNNIFFQRLEVPQVAIKR